MKGWTARGASTVTIVLLIFAACPRPVHAQFTGVIAGSVHDASGAALPGAAITARGPALQRDGVTVASDAVGYYHIGLLPPGTYEVRVELSGFGAIMRREIEVAINQEVRVDFVLELAAVAETVEVIAELPMVDPHRPDLTSRITTEDIDALPLNGRDFEDLITLVPGAKREPGGQQGSDVSIFGERGTAISFIVDGADNNDPLDGGALQRFSQDSIQEFEVITTGYQAQFGRAQGGVINIVTRSGTSRFSGSALLFARDDALDSSNVNDQQVPKLQRQQWGGTLGGPIQRERAFFFASFEVLDEIRGVNIDRSQIADFVLDGRATPQGKEDFSIGPRTEDLTGLVKLDLTLSNSHRLTGTFSRTDDDVSGEIGSPIAGTIALPSAERTELRESTSFSLRESWVIDDRTFLETTGKIVDGRRGNNLGREDRLEPVLVLLRSGFLQTGAPFGGKFERDLKQFQLTQSLTHYRSSEDAEHQIKLGWDWRRSRLTGFNEVTNDVEYSAAFLSPDAARIQGELFQRFGFAQSAARFFTLSANPDGALELDMSNNDLSAFAQDSWRPRADLTLNLGLRYDWASLFGEDKNNLAPRLGLAWDVGGRQQTILKANFGVFFDRNLLTAAATVPELGGVFTRNAFDVALPRLGADYTDSLIDLVITSGFPLPDGGRTPPENPDYRALADSLREDPLALYRILGIAVDNPDLPPVVTADNIEDLAGLSPEEAILLLEQTFSGTDWEFFDVPGGSIVGDRVLSFFPRGPLAFSRDVSRFSNARTPWTRALTVGIDQQIANNIVLSASYVHRRSRDLLTRRIVNLFDVEPGDPNFGRTTDGGPRINQVTYEGEIDYDGVVLALQKRWSDGYAFSLSYTGARARDNLLTGVVGSGFSDNNDPGKDRGPSNQSAPHLFVANALITLPGDLQVSGIVFWRSGNAFNPRGITDQDGDGLVDQRDTSIPRNSFRTDSFFDVDLRVEKRFRLGSRHAIGILVEGFNLTNRANVLNVNAVSGPDFGVPVAFLPGRELQFGIRYFLGR